MRLEPKYYQCFGMNKKDHPLFDKIGNPKDLEFKNLSTNLICPYCNEKASLIMLNSGEILTTEEYKLKSK